jgi:hypothetical protein
MGVISVSDRNPTPSKSIRQATHNRLTKQLRRGNTTMARNNLAVVGRQHRIHEAEALDRRSNLLDLRLAVASRIARIGLYGNHLSALSERRCELPASALSRRQRACRQ